jgi:hypothetical protein
MPLYCGTPILWNRGLCICNVNVLSLLVNFLSRHQSACRICMQSKDSIKVIIIEESVLDKVRTHTKILGKFEADPLSYCRVYGIIDS